MWARGIAFVKALQMFEYSSWRMFLKNVIAKHIFPMTTREFFVLKY